MVSFFTSTTLICNMLGYFGFQYVNFLILTWTPKYLQDEYHFEIHSLWYLGMIPWIGAVFTAYFGGQLSDWLRKDRKSTYCEIWTFNSRYDLRCYMLLIIPFTHSIVAVMILMMIGNAFIFLPNAVYWAVIIDTTPNNTGTYGGITHFFVNTATVIAPTLTGYLVASYGYSSMFVSAVVASLISIIAMCFVRPGEKKMHMT